MASITVYYDYLNGKKAPLWYVIKFAPGEIDWSKTTMYIPVDAPFQVKDAELRDESTLSFSILLSDLTKHPDKPNRFGIHLPYVKARAKEMGIDHSEIEQFVLQVTDIEDVMEMTVIRKWF